MGRDGHIACLDCKIDYDLGYGSCLGWLDTCESVEDFNKWAEKKDLKVGVNMAKRNENVLQVLTEHAGHNIMHWSGDWAYTDNGNLMMPGGYGDDTVYIENFPEF